MAAPTNLSFESAGASPGLAASWTTSTNAASGIVGSFSDSGPSQAVESYETGWLDNSYAIEITGGTSGNFDQDIISPPVTRETYSRWQGPAMFLEIQGGSAGTFEGFATIEQYEGGWLTDTYATEITEPIVNSDGYESGWLGSSYQTEISGGIVGTFDTPSGTETMESYEHIFADVSFAVDVGNNRFESDVPHGLTNGQKGRIISTGKPPGGSQTGINVYVIVLTSTTFRVSVSPGPGTAITITDVGSGDHSFKADESVYWTDVT